MSIEIIGSTLQGVLLIIFAPALMGSVNWLRANRQGRKRNWICVLQPYRDLWKLMHMPAVRLQTASWVFAVAPLVLFTAYTFLVFTIPVFSVPLLRIDVIVVIYILGLARFTLSLAGWDAGASFGGLGSSREMFLHFLTEIELALVIVALALRWGTVDLLEMIDKNLSVLPIMLSNPTQSIQDLGLIFLPIAFAALVLFEAERIPVDNPETHLELTMAQKAITLEYAGHDLALIELAEMIKMMFLFALFCNLFLPLHNFFRPIPGLPTLSFPGLSTVSFIVEIVFLGSLLALWELFQPKTRLRQIPGLAGLSMLFSFITIIIVIIMRSKI